jgi:hypothetical protein
MTSEKDVAYLRVNHSYLSHVLDNYLYKELINNKYSNKEVLTVEKQKTDIAWRKQHDKLLDDWRNVK